MKHRKYKLLGGFMKRFLRKIVPVLLLTVFCYQNALAADIYSHIVLDLPGRLERTEPWVKIIKTREEWKQLYDELTAVLSEADPLPEIDFGSFQLIVGGIGVKSTGGNSLLVQGIYESDHDIAIYILDVIPGAHCSAIAVIDYPMAAFLIRKTEKPMNFYVQHAQTECSD
jgi:hypothetical protein